MNYLKKYNSFRFKPIGVFDSGYGGLTILNRLRVDNPTWDFIYLGDNLTAPYGEMSDDEVVYHTQKGVNFLRDKGCKKIILACNTASSKPELSKSDIIDIVTPTKEFIDKSSADIGLVATESTVNSGVYNKENVFQLACPLWVRIVESVNYSSPESIQIIKSDLEKLFQLNSKIEMLILACTHFNILKSIISSLFPDIKIISQDDLISEWIDQGDLEVSSSGKIEYYTTGDIDEFSTETEKIFGKKIKAISTSI